MRNFGPQERVPDTKPIPQFYECGICGHCHPILWDGDCRDDNNRFTNQELDDKYGADGWEEVPMPGSEVDNG
ncbi:MAG TPA: hypothetical protein VI386_17825 [Candidatus Sulfotelmatobacter sp.]